MQITRIISGGQTGADRGGLDAALARGVAHGGWCPAGRQAEDGTIPARYLLRETQSDVYADRTEANVRDADATIVFTPAAPTGGSLQTIDFCREQHKPCLHIPLDSTPPELAADRVVRWLARGATDRVILNVAGSRESQAPGIHATVRTIMQAVLDRLAHGGQRK